MNIKYNKLFNLSVAHDFFRDGINEDIVIQPDAETSRLLINGKMLYKTIGNNGVVIFKTETNKIDPFINVGPDANFRFYITTEKSSEFFNITKLENYVAGNKLYFTNVPVNESIDSTNPETLTHTLIDSASGKLFTYSFSLTTNHTKTKLRIENNEGELVSPGKDSDGNDLPTTLTLTRNDSKSFSQQIDLRTKPNGIYTIFIENLAQDTNLKTETVFVDNEATRQGVLGIVDIKYSAVNTIYVDTNYYELHFDRKTTIWKYFIVNKSNNVDFNTTNLKIEDSLSGGGTPYAHVDFVLEGAQPNATTQIKGFETVIFKSNVVIPSFEHPKLNVQLLDQSDNELVKHLPNPPFNAVEKDNGGIIEKEIFVFI